MSPQKLLQAVSLAERPAVFFANGHGDHILVLPTIRALAHYFPSKLRIVGADGMVQRYFHCVPYKSAHVMRNMELQRDSATSPAHGWIFDYRAVAEDLGSCDLFLSLIPWRSESTDSLLRLLSPANSIGFFNNFHTQVPLDYTKHSVDMAFDVALNVDPSLSPLQFSAPLPIPHRFRQFADRFRRATSDFKILAVHADTKPEKMWCLRKLMRTLTLFLDSHPRYVAVVIGLKTSMESNEREHDRILCLRGIPIDHTLAVLQNADLFLGVDSCFLHAADLARVPGIGLFGPTSSAEFGFRFSKHCHVDAPGGSMTNIEEDRVMHALSSMADPLSHCETVNA